VVRVRQVTLNSATVATAEPSAWVKAILGGTLSDTCNGLESLTYDTIHATGMGAESKGRCLGDRAVF
jgi:hypothetical protein